MNITDKLVRCDDCHEPIGGKAICERCAVYRCESVAQAVSTPAVEVTADAVEVAAEFIYGTFDGSKSHPWVERGNSLKQGDARDIARQLVAKTFPALVQQVERLTAEVERTRRSVLSEELHDLRAERDTLSADNARLAKDAKRYAVVRSHNRLYIRAEPNTGELGWESLDKWCDAATAQAKQAEGDA
jgi:hypothetical protein